MKKLIFFVVLLSGSTFLFSQTLNKNGLYIDNEGLLFNGTISAHQNDAKSEFAVKEGVINGEAKYYTTTGQLIETGSFVAGKKDGKWIRYNDKGAISAVAFYTNGKKTGTWLVFDDNGKKRFEMNYNNGEKTGVWTSWNENGAVADTKDYTKVN